MEIKICGPGCAKCNEAFDLAAKVIAESGKDVTLTKVTDFQEIAQLGVFSTPAVVVENESKCVGKVPTQKELLSWGAAEC